MSPNGAERMTVPQPLEVMFTGPVPPGAASGRRPERGPDRQALPGARRAYSRLCSRSRPLRCPSPAGCGPGSCWVSYQRR